MALIWIIPSDVVSAMRPASRANLIVCVGAVAMGVIYLLVWNTVAGIILIIVLIIAVGPTIIVWRQSENQHNKEFKQVAEEMGFLFYPKGGAGGPHGFPSGCADRRRHCGPRMDRGGPR